MERLPSTALPSPATLSLPLADLGRWLAAAGSVLLWFVALFLLARRAMDGPRQPLEGSAWLLCGLALAATVAALRLAWWRRAFPAERGAAWRLAYVIPAAAAWVVGVAIWLPGTASWGVAVFWIITAAAEAIWWYVLLRRPELISAGRAEAVPSAAVPASASPWNSAGEGHRKGENTSALLAAEPPPPHVSQSVVRLREPDGCEVVRGYVRCPFAAGERTTSAHVAFCPPLASVPELTFEQLEGPPAAITAGQAVAFGARLDLRLSAAPREPTSVLVEFYARAAKNSQAVDRERTAPR
jgi:hypothetical protein